MSSTNVVIAIAAQTAGAVREIDNVNSALGRQMTAGEKAGKSLQAAAVPAAAAFAAVTAVAVKSVGAAEEAAAANAKLSQVFQSMGFAGLADDAAAYADALSKQIGVDDEIIKGAQTKLATFSEVSRSAETMQQATALAADLAAAGFGDMDSAAVLLGKALQDPVGGLTSLTRVGVQFTDQQKAQIEAMVAAGDTAGAQAVIMGELSKQVGGVAEAGATSSQKLGVAFGEISEAIGAALLPAFEELAPLIQQFADWATENAGPITVIGGIIAAVAGTILVLNGAMLAWTAVTTAWTVVTTIATAVGGAFAAVISFLSLPVLAVIAVIAALIAIGYLLWRNWDTIKAKAVEAWGAITRAVGDAVRNAVEFVRGLPGAILSALGNIGALLYQAGKNLIQGFINGIKSMAGAILNAILSILPSGVRGVIGGALGLGQQFAGTPSSFSAEPRAVAAPARTAPPPVMVTDEQLARAVARLLLRSDARNGRTLVLG